MSRISPEEMRDIMNGDYCENPESFMPPAFFALVGVILMIMLIAAIVGLLNGPADRPAACANLTAAECSAAVTEGR